MSEDTKVEEKEVSPVRKGIREMLGGLSKSETPAEEKPKEDTKPLAKSLDMMKADFNKNKQLLFEKCKDGIAKHKLTSDNVYEIETFYNKTGRIHPDFEGILGKFE